VVDHHHASRDLLDVGDVVRGQEDRHAALGVQPQHEVPEARLGDEVEPDRRLVEEQHLGLVQHAREELAAHPLAERERAHGAVDEVLRREELREPADAAGGLAAREPVDAAEQPERLPRLELEPELRALSEERPDPPREQPPLPPRHEAEHARGARRRVQDAGQHLDRRRLAGAVRADVGEPLAGLDLERDAPDRVHVAAAPVEGLREVGCAYGGHAAR
jgi:hypothetical protein